MKKNILWVISLAVTGLLLYLIFRQVDIENVVSHWKKARFFPLILTLPLSFATNCLLASWKWKYILARLGLSIPFRESLLVKMGSLPVKSVLPFRSGEASRVIYLKRVRGFSAVKSAGSIIIELFFNILVYIILIAAAALLLGIKPDGILYLWITVLLLLLAAFGAASSPFSRSLIRRMIAAIPNPRLRGGVETLLLLHRFFSWNQILVLGCISLLIQAGKLLSFFLICLSLDISLPPEGYFVFLPLSILVATVPVSFLGIGLREGSLTALLVDFCSTPAPAALGATFLFSLTEYVFPVALGLFWTGIFTSRIFSGNKPGNNR